MLFNSIPFLFVFLPLAIAGFFLLRRGQAAFLTVASLVFYACWHAPDLLWLLGSMALNYPLGVQLQKRPSGWLLAPGIAANLLFLGWFKYAGYFADGIVLPLAISFYTLHEITWLVDSYLGRIKKATFGHYALYIAFFPQLIAGPIVRFTEVVDQYKAPGFGKFDIDRCAQGAFLFCIGLCKKVLLADYFGITLAPAFAQAAAGGQPGIWEAWSAALLYVFQLYFDFSAYSDMALGLGLVFGIVLPLNFNSPFKATSIIDFWQRWHMTLSRFLRDYVYIPLGGYRPETWRRYTSLMLTMVVCGLWHGAGWTFVVWGALHGAYLLINHAWRDLFPRKGKPGDLAVLGYGALTFLAVLVAGVFSRAESLAAARTMLAAMTDIGGAGVPALDAATWLMTAIGAGIIWFTPNAFELSQRFASMQGGLWRRASLALGLAAGVAVFLTYTGMKSEFIYFRF